MHNAQDNPSVPQMQQQLPLIQYETQPRISDLEDERRAEDQQRIGPDELLDMDSGDDIVAGPEVQAEEVPKKTRLGINFRVGNRGTWEPASAHTIERSDFFTIEKVTANRVRRKRRLFNIELRMLAPQLCFEAVVADNTYTVLLMRYIKALVHKDTHLQPSQAHWATHKHSTDPSR